MFYSKIKNTIEQMIDDIYAGKEECTEVISYNLIRDQSVPVTLNAKLLYPLNQIKISIYCPFLLVEPDVKFEEIYQQDHVEDELSLMRLIAKFTSILDRMKIWISNEAPDMIRWGEGVIFDKNGKTKKIPYNSNYSSILGGK